MRKIDNTNSASSFFHFPKPNTVLIFLLIRTEIAGFRVTNLQLQQLQKKNGEIQASVSRVILSSLEVSTLRFEKEKKKKKENNKKKIQPTGTRCYEYACINGTLYLNLGITWVECPEQGDSQKNVNGFTGTMNCPAWTERCGPNETTSNSGNVDIKSTEGAWEKVRDFLVGLQWWVWLIVALVILAVILVTVFIIIGVAIAGCCKKRDRWASKKTYDLTTKGESR